MKLERTKEDYPCSWCEQPGAHFYAGKLHTTEGAKSIVVHRKCMSLVVSALSWRGVEEKSDKKPSEES